jgi:hypothetical protein
MAAFLSDGDLEHAIAAFCGDAPRFEGFLKSVRADKARRVLARSERVHGPRNDSCGVAELRGKRRDAHWFSSMYTCVLNI